MHFIWNTFSDWMKSWCNKQMQCLLEHDQQWRVIISSSWWRKSRSRFSQIGGEPPINPLYTLRTFLCAWLELYFCLIFPPKHQDDIYNTNLSSKLTQLTIVGVKISSAYTFTSIAAILNVQFNLLFQRFNIWKFVENLITSISFFSIK